jgi:hypothetical protein
MYVGGWQAAGQLAPTAAQRSSTAHQHNTYKGRQAALVLLQLFQGRVLQMHSYLEMLRSAHRRLHLAATPTAELPLLPVQCVCRHMHMLILATAQDASRHLISTFRANTC